MARVDPDRRFRVPGLLKGARSEDDRYRSLPSGLSTSPSGTERAGRPPQGPDEAARLIVILLSTTDHFMIMLVALLIIFTASLQLL